VVYVYGVVVVAIAESSKAAEKWCDRNYRIGNKREVEAAFLAGWNERDKQPLPKPTCKLYKLGTCPYVAECVELRNELKRRDKHPQKNETDLFLKIATSGGRFAMSTPAVKFEKKGGPRK